MDESQLLISRLEDLIWNYDYSENIFIGFLNEHESALACSYLKNRCVQYSVYGGYENATRVYIALSDDVNNYDYPITALTIQSKGKRELTHRDYLGSLMSLGLKRECIGDIIPLDGHSSVAFVRSDISEYVIRELYKVANEPVKVLPHNNLSFDFAHSFEEKKIIVSSMRVDNILSSLLNCSRSQASDIIADDLVFANYCQVTKPSMQLSASDVLSIRGYGKCIIGDLQGKTKRDRLILNVIRYI